MKKIAIVSNISWAIYNFRLGMMKRLKDEGFDVYFSAAYDSYADKLIEHGFKFIPIEFDRKGRNILNDIRLFLDLYRIYKKNKFDLVLHYSIKPNIYGSIAARCAGARSISTVTGLGYVFLQNNLLSKFVKLLYKVSLRFPEKVFFQNQDDRDLFLKKGFLRRDKALIVKGSGVNTRYFLPEPYEKDPDKDFVFLFSGRILWDKGVGNLVDAFRVVKQKYPRSKCWLLGFIDRGNPSGIPEKTIRRWEEEGVIRYFEGVRDVRPFIARSDAIVYPSYREGMPRTLLEAMAMEKPIITTDSVGCRDVVEEGINGFLVPAKNTDPLAEAMMKIMDLPQEKRLQMGKCGREKVLREFDEDIVLEAYLAEIKWIVEGTKP